MLAMAADLHDRLVCPCGCGQWEADAHDPEKKDQIVVDATTCYVRRALNDYEDAMKPGPDVVLSVRWVKDRADADRQAYLELVNRFPDRFVTSPPAGPPVPEGDPGRDEQHENDGQ